MILEKMACAQMLRFLPSFAQVCPKLLRSKGMSTACLLMNCVNTPQVCFGFDLKGELFVSVNEKSLHITMNATNPFYCVQRVNNVCAQFKSKRDDASLPPESLCSSSNTKCFRHTQHMVCQYKVFGSKVGTGLFSLF